MVHIKSVLRSAPPARIVRFSPKAGSLTQRCSACAGYIHGSNTSPLHRKRDEATHIGRSWAQQRGGDISCQARQLARGYTNYMVPLPCSLSASALAELRSADLVDIDADDLLLTITFSPSRIILCLMAWNGGRPDPLPTHPSPASVRIEYADPSCKCGGAKTDPPLVCFVPARFQEVSRAAQQLFGEPIRQTRDAQMASLGARKARPLDEELFQAFGCINVLPWSA